MKHATVDGALVNVERDDFFFTPMDFQLSILPSAEDGLLRGQVVGPITTSSVRLHWI